MWINKEHLEKVNHLFELMNKEWLYAYITSRPSQVGKDDGYLKEKKLNFYLKS